MHLIIDSSYTIHVNARGHLGLFLTMVRGVMINTSKKLDLVTASFVEKEVVLVGEHFHKYT